MAGLILRPIAITVTLVFTVILTQVSSPAEAARSKTQVFQCLKGLGFSKDLGKPSVEKKDGTVIVRNHLGEVISVEKISKGAEKNSSSSDNTSLKIEQPTALNTGAQNNTPNLRTSAARVLSPLCYVYDTKTVKRMLDSVLPVTNIPATGVTTGRAGSRSSGTRGITVAQGVILEKRREPGLIKTNVRLGLDGAEEMLAELLVQEAYGFWMAAIQAGAKIIPTTQKDIKNYVTATLEAAKKDPDKMISLKVRAWQHVQSVVLGRDLGSAATKRFIKAVQNYIRSQHVQMARDAKKQYEKYVADHNNSYKNRGLMGTLNIGPEPFDTLKEMERSLTTSAAAVSFYAAVQAVETGKPPEGVGVFSPEELKNYGNMALDQVQGALIDEIVDAGLGAIEKAARKAIAKAVRQAMYRSSGRASGGLTAKVMERSAKASAKIGVKVAGRVFKISAKAAIKFVKVVPIVGEVISTIVDLADAGVKVGKNEHIKKKLQKAEAAALKGNWSLKDMMSRRQTSEQVLFFYAKAATTQSPIIDASKLKPPACRVCLHSEKNGLGEGVCTSSRESDLRTRKFNNKARSVVFHGDPKKCGNPSVVLHENTKHKGHKLVLHSDVANLALHKRGKGITSRVSGAKHYIHNWDRDISSMEYIRKGAPRCEVCLYDKPNYKGAKICAANPIASLKEFGMYNKTSSIKFYKTATHCKKAQVWVYDKPNYERLKNGKGVAKISKNVPKISKKWNNKISSLYFSPTGVNQKEQKVTTGCLVCLYEHEKHKGNFVCLHPKKRYADLNAKIGTKTYKFRNKAKSVDFVTNQCKNGDQLTLILFSRANYKGKQAVITKDFKSLGKFNKAASSAQVILKTAAQIKRSCDVCLYEHANYKGNFRCTKPAKVPSLKVVQLNNRVSSVRFVGGACRKPRLELFEDPNFKSYKTVITKNVPSLGKLKLNPKKNLSRKNSWNDVADSFRYTHKR